MSLSFSLLSRPALEGEYLGPSGSLDSRFHGSEGIVMKGFKGRLFIF